MYKRTTLSATVGTSLEGNLRRTLDPANPAHQEALRYLNEENWSLLGSCLAREFRPNDPILGAEISSIACLLERRLIEPESLYLLHSDTPEGNRTTQVLSRFFENHPSIRFRRVERVRIEGLQDQEPERFRIEGLRNLARELGKIIHKWPMQVAIDATGGYKAQIAVASIVGQALQIPVYYKHEKFVQVVAFPPMPVSPDYHLLQEHRDLFHRLEREKEVPEADLREIPEPVMPLLEEIVVDGVRYYALAPIGQVYLDAYRLRTPRVSRCPRPATGNQRGDVSFRDDHYPPGFKEHVQKVFKSRPYITRCVSLPYDKQRSIRGTGFSIAMEREGSQPTRYILGTFRPDDFGARFRVYLTEEQEECLEYVLEDLNNDFAD